METHSTEGLLEAEASSWPSEIANRECASEQGNTMSKGLEVEREWCVWSVVGVATRVSVGAPEGGNGHAGALNAWSGF